MKLESGPKIYDPFDGSTEQYKGNIPTFYSKYILRSVPDESSDLEEMMNSNEDVLPASTQQIYSKLKHETFPRILFLGTGSGEPTLFRNSSAILVHLS